MAKKYEIIVERDASRVSLDIQQIVPALPAIAGAPAAAERAELAAQEAEGTVERAKAWAASLTPPDPAQPQEKSAKGYALEAETAALIAQSRADIVLTTLRGSVGVTLDTLTYGVPGVTAGAIIRDGSSNLLFEVLPLGATGAMITGAAGVRYRLRSQNGVLDASALYQGDIGAAINACVAEINRAAALASADYSAPSIMLDAARGPFTQTTPINLKVWTPLVTAGGDVRITCAYDGTDPAWLIDGMGAPSSLSDTLVAARGGSIAGSPSGSIHLTGPGVTKAGTIGIFVGNEAMGATRSGAVRCPLGQIVVRGFETGIRYSNYDTYLTSLYRVTVLDSDVAIVLGDGASNNNAGERHSIWDSTFVARDWGMVVNSPGLSVDIMSSSFDFCRQGVLKLGPNARYAHYAFHGGHWECSSDVAFIKSEIGASNASIPVASINNIRTEPSTTSAAAAAALGRDLPDHGRPDGRSSQRVGFEGKVDVAIDGFYLPYAKHNWSAENNLFLCDDDVRLIQTDNIVMPLWKLIPQSRCVSRGWNFAGVEAGTGIFDGTVPAATYGGASTLQYTAVSGDGLGDSDISLNVTATGAGQFISITSEMLPYRGGSQMVLAAIKAPGSTGDLSVQTQLHYFDDHWRVADGIATAAIDGIGRITMTCLQPHGLLLSDIVARLCCANRVLAEVPPFPGQTYPTASVTGMPSAV